MRNTKQYAREEAKTMMEDALDRLRRIFQKEMLHLLVEYEGVRDLSVKRDKEVSKVGVRMVDQEREIA